ncbi:MAG TPA: hypothetical protein VGH98_08760 [Gemmatimonadaceae bacterium]|jgi:hypothetical protein
MLPLKPEPIVATAIALASWQYQRSTRDVGHDRGFRRREAP